MSEKEHSRSRELDKVRRLLFPNLSAKDGWARIDAAFEGASDPARIDAIERLVDPRLGGLAGVARVQRRDAA
jgi:hypothetical protein